MPPMQAVVIPVILVLDFQGASQDTPQVGPPIFWKKVFYKTKISIL
jgi:hypothetical protein